MRRRLLVITSSFPRGEADLAGHFVRSWCRALVAQGYELDVLAWRGPGAKSGAVGPGLNVYFVPYGLPTWERLFFGAGAPENLEKNPLAALMALPAMAAMLRAALGMCRERRYTAVVGHWLVPGGVLARAVGRWAGVPSFVVGHSGGVHLLERLGAVMGGGLSRVVTAGPTTVPTRALREKLERLGGSPAVAVAPMGYDAVGYDAVGYEAVGYEAVKRLEGRANEGLRLGFLGRLVPIKGLETVLEALKGLDAGLKVGLDVVGEGPCRGMWEGRAGEGVRFWGAKFGAEKGALLRSWDGLVLPSEPRGSGRTEGLPVSLLEAASVGAVPLVSGIPAVEPWLARPGRQVVLARDVEGWRRAIVGLARSSAEERRCWRGQTRRLVAPLAWPVYGAWWKEWLEAG